MFPLIAGLVTWWVWRRWRAQQRAERDQQLQAWQNRPQAQTQAPQPVSVPLGPITVPRGIVEALPIFAWQGEIPSPDITTRRRPGESVESSHTKEVDMGTERSAEPAGTSPTFDLIEPPANLYQARFSQNQCTICIEDFVDGSSRVREMPCGHIFHPECIDPYLTERGTRCPNCQQAAWTPPPPAEEV